MRECRSLVLRLEDNIWHVESRSFDRFFNHGEDINARYDITTLKAVEKIDGSLVSVWWNKSYGWLYRTKSMIMPNENVSINGHELTWKRLIESVVPLEYLEDLIDIDGCTNYTHIFEVVSRENRVVTEYSENQAYLIGCRGIEHGDYIDIEPVAELFMVDTPKTYTFDTFEDCVDATKELPNLEEGYVMVDANNIPVLKLKSPAYVAAHRLRGEGTPTPKRIMDMIFINEQDEYLTIFPEEEVLFKPYITAFEDLLLDYEDKVELCKNINDQKEFAMEVKELPIAGMLFTKRKNPELYFRDIFDNLTVNTKYRLTEDYKI